MKEYRIRASNSFATYNAGRFVAESEQEACEIAKEAYSKSAMGRQLKDVGAFRFYAVERFPHEEAQD